MQIPAVDQEGRDKAGNPVANLPEGDNLARAAFASDIGVDNEGLRARTGGYVWFDVTGIEPPRDKTLEEVRAEVDAAMAQQRGVSAPGREGRQLVERLDKGESIETLAAEVNAPVKSATDIARRQAKDELTTEAVARVFATPRRQGGERAERARHKGRLQGHGGDGAAAQHDDATGGRDQEPAARGPRRHLLEEYVADLQKDIGVTVNRQAML